MNRPCRVAEEETALEAIPMEAETLASLGVTLLDHQVYALRWMVKVEAYPGRMGGILADHMGMGKTLTCCALIKSAWMRGERLPQLVVCPKSVLPHWKAELSRCGVRVTELSKRDRDPCPTMDEAETDLPLVYLSSTIALCYRKAALERPGGWARVIVDEAHLVNNPRAHSYIALAGLHAAHKWAVTGTPLLNAVKDVCALSRLVTPKDAYPAHDARAAREWKNRYFLRRTKAQSSVALPEMVTIEEWICPTDEELDAYRRIAVRVTDRKAAHGNVLTSLSDLRRQCDHPEMASSAAASSDGGSGRRRSDDDRTTSGGPWTIPEDAVRGSVPVTTLVGTCPGVPGRAGQTPHDPTSSDTIPDTPVAHSSKTARMLEIIRSYPADTKFVVFSQWTKMLDICERLLAQEGYASLRFDGAIQEAARRVAVIQEFGESCRARVLLTSLRAGGVGLNLTMANVIIQLDPWWNYCSEEQAYSRVYRIGQHSKVYVHRLLVRCTVEEQVLMIQSSKNVMSASFLSREVGESTPSFGPEDVRAIYTGPNRTRAHRLGAVTSRAKRPKLIQCLRDAGA